MIRCNIPYRPIIESAIQQTSVDFKALRLQNPQIDAAYEDFVMSGDEYSVALSELRGDITDSFYSYFQSNISEFIRDNSENLYILFSTTTNSNLAVLESLIHNMLKYSLLSWWYAQRNEQLFVQYTKKYISSSQEISDLLQPRIHYGQGSYY